MKRLILFLMILMIVPLVHSQEIREYVNDYADIIDPVSEQELDLILKQIYDSDVAEYSIVTVNSLEGKAIESYSLELAQGKLGDSEKNNGLLLLVSVSDRQYRFEVGRGLEYILNDAKVGRIGRTYLVPYFQEEEYGLGILEASKSVRSILLGDNVSEYYIGDSEEYNMENVILIFNLIIFIMFFILIPILMSKSKSKNRYFDAALGAVILFGGGRRGGGGSGGFGGFGGGGFGGGGASGGW